MWVFDEYFSTCIDAVEVGGPRWVGPGFVESDGVWWIVSGENPMDARLGDAVNLVRHRELGREWPDAIEVVCSAVGWRERSWAVRVDLVSWVEVLAQARRFGQRAVFRVTAEWVEVVMTSVGREGEVVGRRDRGHRAGWVRVFGGGAGRITEG